MILTKSVSAFFIKKGRRFFGFIDGWLLLDYTEVKRQDVANHCTSCGGLPEDMNLSLIEPLRNCYKDEVRELGQRLQ